MIRLLRSEASVWTYVTRPRDTACLSADQVTRISGPGIEAIGKIDLVRVAVKRLRGDGCSWLTDRRAGLRPRPCSRPVWLSADIHRDENRRLRYRLPLARVLPRGRYVAYSQADYEPGLELARNKVRFRIR